MSSAIGLSSRAARKRRHQPIALTEGEPAVVPETAPNAAGAAAAEFGAKTVAVHVSNILSKLGAATRNEAAAIAHRVGLTPAAEAATPPFVPRRGS